MGRTQLTTRELGANSVNKDDVDITTSTKSLITNVIAGVGVAITNTGTDTGTGAVTIKADKEVFMIACSDLTTALTTGTTKAYFRMPFAGTLTAVKASVLTAPTGSTILIDINESGTTVISTKLMIDATEKTSATAATPYVISDSSLADDAEITIDIDQIGSTIAGAGLVVYLFITRTT